ncbi:MAG: putative hydroxymethylpyrimidine transporter CytX [Tissierellia bacterium]|nr:putative hydroxymethylpyrimidine transporter CytX [Tissierellia bacterium]
MDKRTSVFANGLIWFGAAVSIAEILTGTYFAPLGFSKALTAIIIGHIVGGILMFLTGLIGAQTRRSSMETVKMSFGYRGGLFFAALNIVQLAGWTSIMIYDGSLTANQIINTGSWLWALIIAVFIIIWLLVGVKNLDKINLFAMTALFILTLILSKIIFSSANQVLNKSSEGLSFGSAVELAAVMPISWLPVISDYTRDAKKPLETTFASSLIYSLVSIWMYIIGMGAAIYTGEDNISSIMLKAGLGLIGLLIVIFSTVTTTFLDAYSAGVSYESISKKISSSTVAISVTALGMLLAIFYPIDDISNFLYFIGSVFTPMIAILIGDYFILKENHIQKSYNIKNIIIWTIGFIIYRWLLKADLSIGSALPNILLTLLISIMAGKFLGDRNKIRK